MSNSEPTAPTFKCSDQVWLKKVMDAHGGWLTDLRGKATVTKMSRWQNDSPWNTLYELTFSDGTVVQAKATDLIHVSTPGIPYPGDEAYPTGPTVKSAQEAKREMEKEIADVILRFHARTGLRVSRVHLGDLTHRYDGTPSLCAHVDVKL